MGISSVRQTTEERFFSGTIVGGDVTMSDKKTTRIPEVLCPFLERECPRGENTARFCHRLLGADIDLIDDFGRFWVDCFLAARMFSTGHYPFN